MKILVLGGHTFVEKDNILFNKCPHCNRSIPPRSCSRKPLLTCGNHECVTKQRLITHRTSASRRMGRPDPDREDWYTPLAPDPGAARFAAFADNIKEPRHRTLFKTLPIPTHIHTRSRIADL